MPLTFDTPTTPAVMRSCIIEPGATLEVAAANNFDVMGVVLASDLALRGGSSETPVSASSWTAFRRVDGALWLENSPTGSPAAVVIVVARTVLQQVSLAARQPTPSRGARFMDMAPDPGPRRIMAPQPQAQPIQLVSLTSLQVFSWGAGSFRARIAFEGPGSSRASLGVLVGAARAGVAAHVHEHSYELLTPVIADGMLRIPSTGDESLGTQSVIRPGDSQVIAAGVSHAWVPAGTVPLIAVQAYAPPGPEQRYRSF